MKKQVEFSHQQLMKQNEVYTCTYVCMYVHTCLL